MKMHKPPMPKQAHTLYRPKERLVSLKSAAWQALREQVLAEQPICEHCYNDYGRVTPATDVDHIDNDGNNNARYNLQSLCHSCHSIKTRAEMQGKERPVYGCDVNGYPLDPNHFWNRKITSNREAKDRRGTLTHAVAVEGFR